MRRPSISSSLSSSSSRIQLNYQGCIDEIATASVLRSTSKDDRDERFKLLVSLLTWTEKASMHSCRDSCDTCPCAIPRVGLSPYAYLVEAPQIYGGGLSQCCYRLSTARNRRKLQSHGVETERRSISTEMRAFANHGGVRGLGKEVGLASGFGPNTRSRIRDLDVTPNCP